MTVIVFILLLVIHGHCQLIFPDDFETTNYTPNYGKILPRRLPFPTLPSPMTAMLSENQTVPMYYGRNYLTAVPGGLSALLPQAQSSRTIDDEQIWTNHMNNILRRGVTKFALKMNQAIDEHQKATTIGLDPDNVVFSPVNLVSILAIILTAAAGRTFDETVNLLGFDLNFDISKRTEIIHHMLGSLLNSVELQTKIGMKQLNTNNCELSIAGGVFVQNDYHIRPEFQAIAKNIYKNDVVMVNFAQQTKIAQDIINNWVKSKTCGKIQNILEKSPDENTKIILASALFFHGEWNQHFLEGATKRKPFFLSSGRTININMMYNGGSFPFYEDKGLGIKILGLPYKNTDGSSSLNDHMNLNADSTFQSETTMYILLPTSTHSNAIDDLQFRLTPDIIDQLIGQMKSEICIIGLPKMKLSSSLNLNSIFQSLGFTSIFNPTVADLSLLSFGLNSTHSINSNTDDPVIFPRFNVDDVTTQQPNNIVTGKKNYIRYEDINGGYSVKQWDSGVYLEKINRGNREKRRALRESTNKKYYTHQDDLVNDSNIHHRVKVNKFTNNKYHFDEMKRNKRQSQRTNVNFPQFIESEKYRQYGLDALRNSENLFNPGLYVSDVLHKVEIDITETGTVAAAATGVIIQRNGNQKRLIANRPFIFFIRHELTKLILFWGTVNKPTPNYS